jgi:hypothetical protein
VPSASKTPYRMNSDRPHLEGLDEAPADQVWTPSLDQWMAEREPRMKEWRETFGIK